MSTAETQTQRPHWYAPGTGIYTSKHRSVSLPTDPFIDLPSFVLAHKHDGQIALLDSSTGSSISYSQIPALVGSLASGLRRLGVSRGDVVLLLLPNSIYFPVIFLAVLSLGAIVTTINPLSSVLEIRKRVADCNVCFAFSAVEKADLWKYFDLPVIWVPQNMEQAPGFSLFRDLIHGEFCGAPRPIIRQDDVAAIMYSSGTTGESKGVVLTHRNFIAMVELFVRFEASQYDYSPSKNVYLAVLPMFHVYGLSLFGVGLLSLGSTIVVMNKFYTSKVLEAIDKYKVTHFPVVPPILAALTTCAKGVCGDAFKSLKQVSSGAAPLSWKFIQDFLHTFTHVDFIQGYGMTESTAVGTRGFNTENFRKYSSIGLLAPNMEAKIVDWKSGSFLPPGCSGELWLRGPGVMQGYLNNDQATAAIIDKDGWLHTGDIICFDEDGYLHIFDRIKEIIKYKGFQIAPADLEAVLISHPEIVDVAVTAAVDEECGEVPIAFVVKKNGSTLTATEVIDYVAVQVAPYKKVRKVAFINSIPKSAAGKLLRRELRNYMHSRL